MFAASILCIFVPKKNAMFSKNYIRLSWITLLLVYLVIIAGSVVRTSGSGMGCPDWPKCFGQWVPPTTQQQLPADYKVIYGEQRVKKVEKFARFLTALGMKETAAKIKKDPRTYDELPFNAGKTWTEYVNRLVGFLAGNGVLLLFLWSLVRYRSDRRILLLTFFNLIAITLNAWFGSIVVATNLVPWTITVHLFLAYLVVLLQLLIIRRAKGHTTKRLNLPNGMQWLLVISLIITTYQLFLGTQVREYVDALRKMNLGRESWTNYFGWSFFIHRSFSWLVLVFVTLLAYFNHKTDKIKSIYWAFIALSLELIGGVLLAYADMPGLVQVSHLFFASTLFGFLLYTWLNTKQLKGVQFSKSLR